MSSNSHDEQARRIFTATEFQISANATATAVRYYFGRRTSTLEFAFPPNVSIDIVRMFFGCQILSPADDDSVRIRLYNSSSSTSNREIFDETLAITASTTHLESTLNSSDYANASPINIIDPSNSEDFHLRVDLNNDDSSGNLRMRYMHVVVEAVIAGD